MGSFLQKCFFMIGQIGQIGQIETNARKIGWRRSNSVKAECQSTLK
jgi:hypothetical protein